MTGKWISINDNPPHPGNLVLAHVIYGDGHGGDLRERQLLYYNSDMSWRTLDNMIATPGIVTHWMPLPDLPEEVRL